MKYTVAFFGTPHFSVPILESLTEEFDIKLVVSQPDKPVGKGRQVAPSAVSQKAQALGLNVHTPSILKKDTLTPLMQSIDIAVVVAYGKILPQWLLDLPRFGAINIHASLLPKYRGASPISASILEGNAVTGISYIVMNNKMDEGDIIFQSELPIDPTETSGSLAIKLSHSASNDINNVVYKYISGELVASPQDESKATYCSVLSKEDGKIDFEQLPQNLDRMVRAYHPWPGVWGMYNGKRVKLLPGTQVQMEGKKATSLANFKNGYPDFPIDAF